MISGFRRSRIFNGDGFGAFQHVDVRKKEQAQATAGKTSRANEVLGRAPVRVTKSPLRIFQVQLDAG